MNDLFTKDKIIEAYNNAPDFVRTAFNDESTTRIIMGLQTKFQLHIDQAGILGKEVGYLLIGLINQEKFALRLKNSGFADDAITEIAKELNEKVFMPIRKEEETGAMKSAQVPVPAPSPVPTAPQPTSYFKLENKIPLTHSAPQPQQNEKSVIPGIAPKGGLPPKAFLPRTATLGEIVRSVLAAPKPLDDTRLLEDHEEPHMEINKIAIPQVRERVVPSPQNLPGAMPSLEIPRAEEIKPILVTPEVPKVEVPSKPIVPKPEVPTPPVADTPVEPKPIVPTPVTSYSSDPYREPIDEPPTK